MKKHAYLIMAFNDYDLLKKLLLMLDNPLNDIYLHIDKKSKDFKKEEFNNLLKYSKVFIIKRIRVDWSTYSQTLCELNLLKAADGYDYYHLLSGSDLPLKSQTDIHSFFAHNKYEYVDYFDHQKINESCLERVKYYHIMNKYLRSNNKILKKVGSFVHYRFLNLQKKLNINRLKNCPFEFRKGANWFSITKELRKYVLENEKKYLKYFKHTYCADELFLQTILFNSPLYKNVYCKDNNNCLGIKRYIDWNRGLPYTFRNKDYEELINTDAFFARKFSSKVCQKVINRLYNKIVGDNND